ncbi:MAG: acyl-ACP--UDP-N-acetylglucosamine O-acyltransferase [Leptolyngbyaceae cyanobacterium]
MSRLIHPTAVIHPGATLHPTVKVGPYAVIGEKVTVGPETDIGAHVVIDGHTEIGANNQIFPGAVIGIEPQDLKYDGSISLVKIGDNNRIREYVTVNRATHAGEATLIGNDNLLMAYVHVAHNCIIENQVIIANAVALAGHVEIESNAVIGGVLGIHQFVRIGQYAMLGGMSRIDRDVPPYMVVEGNPCRVRGLNTIGLRRAGITDLEDGRHYRELKEAYRMLYRSDSALDAALVKLDEWTARNQYVNHLQSFLQQSTHGAGRRGPMAGALRHKAGKSGT